jgi:hypothetical protein
MNGDLLKIRVNRISGNHRVGLIICNESAELAQEDIEQTIFSLVLEHFHFCLNILIPTF